MKRKILNRFKKTIKLIQKNIKNGKDLQDELIEVKKEYDFLENIFKWHYPEKGELPEFSNHIQTDKGVVYYSDIDNQFYNISTKKVVHVKAWTYLPKYEL
jgi:hypothetical protein